MKKLAIVFIVAVLVPSVVLAWLAMRSLRDQEIVVQSQLALLHQGRTDSLAADLRVQMDDIRSYFGTLVDELVDSNKPDYLCTQFDSIVRSRWGQAWAGCVVTEGGQLVAPAEDSNEPRLREFLDANGQFLTNNMVAEVFQAPLPMGNLIQLEVMEQAVSKDDRGSKVKPGAKAPDNAEKKSGSAGEAELAAVPEAQDGSASSQDLRQRVVVISGKMRSVQQSLNQSPAPSGNSDIPQAGTVAADTIEKLQQQAASADTEPGNNADALPQAARARNVFPFKQLDVAGWGAASQVAQETLGDFDNASATSNYNAASGEVRDIIGDQREGALSRFLDDGLHVLLWYRHPSIVSRIFWVELDLEEIRRDLASVVKLSAQGDRRWRGSSRNQGGSRDQDAGLCVALLDAESRPVAQTVAGFVTDWKNPFVASEVGEILPQWEVAAYFLDPSQVASSASTTRLTLWLLVPILLAAIGFGSLMIFRDVSREMHAARQKTDFVSNVSHELKTPLTSIRMFSDLLGKKPDADAEKLGSYAGIISTEAARLTRLINNLLDFSRMERGERKYDRVDFDAVNLVEEVVKNYRLQIESEGIELNYENQIGEAATVRGDRDALAQVIVNLLSNAEKYGASGGKVRVEVRRGADGDCVEICVLDRGPGISRKEAARIFEKFYRVDDSLASGIQGSGLGLTLARQIARGHGGEVECCGRGDGESGSCFLLRLPLVANPGSAESIEA